jgi:hypothetical protein
MNYRYDERVNEQVIDDDYPRDGADRCSFYGMPGVGACTFCG